MTLKKKFMIIFIIISAIVAILLSMNYSNSKVLEKDWDLYNNEASKRLILIGDLKSQVGYGGIIHQFKNYVIRGQQKQVDKINKLYGNFQKTMKSYKSIASLRQGISTLCGLGIPKPDLKT